MKNLSDMTELEREEMDLASRSALTMENKVSILASVVLNQNLLIRRLGQELIVGISAMEIFLSEIKNG